LFFRSCSLGTFLFDKYLRKLYIFDYGMPLEMEKGALENAGNVSGINKGKTEKVAAVRNDGQLFSIFFKEIL